MYFVNIQFPIVFERPIKQKKGSIEHYNVSVASPAPAPSCVPSCAPARARARDRLLPRTVSIAASPLCNYAAASQTNQTPTLSVNSNTAMFDQGSLFARKF